MENLLAFFEKRKTIFCENQYRENPQIFMNARYLKTVN